MLLAKQPSRVEIYNNLNGELVNFYRVVCDPTQLKRLLRALDLSLYFREEFELAKLPSAEAVESARGLMVRQRQSFGGLGQHWSYVVTDSCQHGFLDSPVEGWGGKTGTGPQPL